MSVVLWFAWRDNLSSVIHPAGFPSRPVPAVPDDSAKAWVAGIKSHDILPTDRVYYASFFDGLGWILTNDGNHDSPLIDTNEKLRRFYSGSLDLAIEKASVGRYAGLAGSLDKAFAIAASGIDPSTLTTPDAIEKAVSEGLSPRPMTKALRERLIRASAAVAWKMGINGE